MMVSRLALLALTGCSVSASYLYTPQGPTHWADGYLATAIDVPPEAPQGRIEIASFGVVEIKPDGISPLTTLHVRLTVTNESDATPWTLDTHAQYVEIATSGRSSPIYVNSDHDSLPVVTIARRERRVLDCYFALPPELARDDEVPVFDVLWEVTTPARTVSSRTRFRRVEYEPPPTTHVVYEAGRGPYWWYDPHHGRTVFIGVRPIVVHHPGRVIVTRPPLRHRGHR